VWIWPCGDRSSPRHATVWRGGEGRALGFESKPHIGMESAKKISYAFPLCVELDFFVKGERSCRVSRMLSRPSI
jgi:hypothetical protein